MSRVMVFDLQNRLAGELTGIVNRGWAINNGGHTSLAIPLGNFTDGIMPDWLQFGRFVLIEHPKLPSWAGFIDPPWKATIPPEMTLYDAAYALSIRIVETDKGFTGNTGTIISRLVDNANSREELYIRSGSMYQGDAARYEEFKRTGIWEQMLDIVKRANMELTIRPEVSNDRQLLIYVDVQSITGVEDDYILHDGENGNMQISGADIDGTVINRVMGTSDESKESSRKKTDWMIDQESITQFRMRDSLKVFTGVTSQTQLEEMTRVYLAQNGQMSINLKVEVFDVGDTFYHLRLGNTLIVRGTRVVLPGGERGWSGRARIMAMNYNETGNTVSMSLTGAIE